MIISVNSLSTMHAHSQSTPIAFLFFDFATDDCLVLSLLPAPEIFAEGVRRLAGLLGEPRSCGLSGF